MGWKLPFNLAILFHLTLISSAILLPKVLHTRPKLPDFTTVNLVNIADMLPPAAVSAPPPRAKPVENVAVTKVSKKIPSKTAPIAEIAKTESVTEPAKAISIKPLKRKLKKKVPPGNSTQDLDNKRKAVARKKALARQQELEVRSQQLQDEAKRQKAIAEAEAKLAAGEAISALRQSLRAETSANSNNNNMKRAGGSGGSSSALEAQYFSSIFSHLHQYWSLPDIKQWDPQLTAVVVITIAQNGRIINNRFEKRSGDRVFDQFVSRTIQDANPLPAIPRALKEQQYTLGLRFKPGQIQ
jgi:colicin import membrane protein